jgi:hypothetical protein
VVRPRRARKLEEVADLVVKGEMPEGTYTWMHPVARLTDVRRRVIVEMSGER